MEQATPAGHSPASGGGIVGKSWPSPSGAAKQATSVEHARGQDGDGRLLLQSITNKHLEKIFFDRSILFIPEILPFGYQPSFKGIFAGNHVEIFEYQRARVKTVKPGRSTGRPKGVTRMRPDSGYRAKRLVKDLLRANVGRHKGEDKFITLTYAKDMEDIVIANSDVNKFIKRLRYRYGPFEYVAVPEIQHHRFEKYGVEVIHYHIATFGLGFVPQEELLKIWGHGHVWIERIRDYRDPGAYMAKYLGKDFSEAKFCGHRRVFNSQHLHRAEVHEWHKASEVLEYLEYLGVGPECLEAEFTYDNNPIVGPVRYKRYNLQRREKHNGGSEDGKVQEVGLDGEGSIKDRFRNGAADGGNCGDGKEVVESRGIAAGGKDSRGVSRL